LIELPDPPKTAKSPNGPAEPPSDAAGA